MTDVFTPVERSRIMQRVKSKGNRSTENRLIQYFDELSVHGWKRNYKVIGHPDFVFLNKRIAVFVDGCFWHGHDCRNTIPASNKDYWEKKRLRNIEHDKRITERFEDRGWIVIRIWECELKRKNREILLNKLSPIIQSESI